MAEEGHGVGADLVGHIAVGGNAVRPHDGQLNLTLGQEPAGHVVRDQSRRGCRPAQLPGRQPGPLEERAGFVHKDMHFFARVLRRADHPEGRPQSDRGQGAGVAVMNDGIAIVVSAPALSGPSSVDRHVFFQDLFGFFQYCPAQSVSIQVLRLYPVVHPATAQKRLIAVGRADMRIPAPGPYL